MRKPISETQQFVNDAVMTTVDHIPVIARMCHQIGLIDTINESIPCRTDVDPGTLVVGMICDTLSGRSPLYKVEEFIATQDTELLFGSHVNAANFNDDALGNTLDRLHKHGTHKLFTKISLNAAASFNLDLTTVNFDTTSVNLWGDYHNNKTTDKAPQITYGYSKDKRPDLKQFMISMLCAENNIPITGNMQNGNSSDNKLNNQELQNIAAQLKPFGKNISEITYIADSKLICSNNMTQLEKLNFASLYPANFKQHDQLIHQALAANQWEPLGILAETPSNSKNRPRASYQAHENTLDPITIDGKTYRGIVIQTDHLDKKPHNTIATIHRNHTKAKTTITKKLNTLKKTTYHCEHDAATALKHITKKNPKAHYNITGSITQTPIYAPGRTPKNGIRKIKSTKYTLSLTAEQNPTHLENLLKKAGCFVLITNLPQKENSASNILKTYKGQTGVEQNFSFLKDPLIVNDTFLKTPSRIEALTMILLLSLMIWNLLQRALRNSKECAENQLKDLNKRTTKRPTSYLLQSHLKGTIILKYGNQRYLARNTLKAQGQTYLKALGYVETIYLNQPAKSKTHRRPVF